MLPPVLDLRYRYPNECVMECIAVGAIQESPAHPQDRFGCVGANISACFYVISLRLTSKLISQRRGFGLVFTVYRIRPVYFVPDIGCCVFSLIGV